MQICKNLYKLSGVEYGTNSNNYAVKYSGGLLMFDCGESELQWERIQEALKSWELDDLPVTHLFLTHSDADHCGNAWRLQEKGTKIIIAPGDRQTLEEGGTMMTEVLHGGRFVGCVPDETPEDGTVYEFDGVTVEMIYAPGHTPGSCNIKITVGGKTAICTGDNFEIGPLTARDDIVIKCGNMAGIQFNLEDYLKTYEKMTHIQADYILPGHYYCHCGDCQQIFIRANDELHEELRTGKDKEQKVWMASEVRTKMGAKGFSEAEIEQKIKELGW